MISDILDYSQAINNKIRINCKDFSTVKLIDEVFDLFEYQAAGKNV